MIGEKVEKIGLLQQLTYILISLISIFYILYIGSNLIIPFLISVLIALFLLGLSNLLQKIKIPNYLSMLFSIIIFILILVSIGNIINNNIQLIVDKIPTYQIILNNKINIILTKLHIENELSFGKFLSHIDLQSLVKTGINQIMFVLANIGIIIFYTLFILLEIKYIDIKLTKIISKKKDKKYFLEISKNIRKSLNSYFIIKTLISLVTAILSYIVMISFGLDFAIFWSFLIFGFNFIPTIGSIIAVTFPIILAYIQFINLLPVLLIGIFLIGIQLIMGNIIEPKFMGNKLNLSPLTIIIALSFWGSLWGIVGMILSIPLMILLNIILAQIPTTRKFSILMSEKGQITICNKKDIL